MKITWLTDIHLNLLNRNQRLAFYDEISKADREWLLITGDIAEPPLTVTVLEELCQHVPCTIYFVLGNHDYYQQTVAQTRAEILALCEQYPQLHYITLSEGVLLQPELAMVGVDGWIDFRYGEATEAATLRYADENIIGLTLTPQNSVEAIISKRQALADADAAHLSKQLTKMIDSQAKKIIILTHVPPFVKAWWHKDFLFDEDLLAVFTAQATGEIIDQFARQYPEINFLLLCGHVH
ncbi:MAG: metallophosphoesterase, partial [Gammaproteobacteria bacterium]